MWQWIWSYTWAYELKPIWGGTKFLPEKFVTAIRSPKKKKRSSPVSLHLFHHFWPKHVTKREAKKVMTFFFFLVVIPFFVLPDLVTLYLEMIESKRSKKYKHTYSNCPKNQNLPEILSRNQCIFTSRGASAPPDPHFLRLWSYIFIALFTHRPISLLFNNHIFL